MTTSATKTRALCVATRCTSVEQFVATFHRFCGDDETFFVATMTSRPIGLETPFSIQLADKQPVLRGLCIVLDAWATPENRYKRPGIRLGIKRLTAESQVVFDRLKAASKAPDEIAEASPPPGPPPVPPFGAAARPPAFPLRAAATPPPLPTLIAPRPGPSVRASTATPSPVLRAPALEPRRPLPEVKPPEVKPPEAKPAEAKPAEAKPPKPAEAKPAEAKSAEAKPPAIPHLPALEPTPPAVETKPEASPSQPAPQPGRRPTPAPIAVTRFQIALNVDAVPPSIDDVEFKPTQLVPRHRIEPRIVSDPAPADAPDEPGKPALIVDRPSAADAPPPHGGLPDLLAQIAAAAPDLPPLPIPDLRTPGSAFVLPANPLQDLSDESLEGFVDCTLYEETGNFFHPTIDGGEWNDEAADPPATPLATRTMPPSSVPAMPFDTPPNLTVRAHGDTESLRVALDEPAPPVPPPAAGPADSPPFGLTATDALFAPLHDRPESATPWLESAGAAYSEAYASPPPPDPDFALREPPSLTMPSVTSQLGPAVHLQPYPTVDARQYARHTAPHPIAPQQAFAPSQSGAQPEPHARQARQTQQTGRQAQVWQRWIIIGGTAVVAIVVAFVVARLIRGPAGAEREPVTAGAPAVTPPPVAPGLRPAPHAGSGPEASQAALRDQRPTAAVEPAGSAAAQADLQPDDEGEAVAGGTPVVGSGPCRFTVSTTPAGSIVRVDDQAMGPSPITVEGTCDKHKVDVSHARYQNLTRWVTLVADKPQELDISLPRPIHAVTVTSFPPGAELSIDGHRAGTTPTVVQMMGFATVNLTFTKPGFQSVTKRVYSKVPQDRVFVKLMK
jgi:hypothetical protein